jgi:hypothetical protein
VLVSVALHAGLFLVRLGPWLPPIPPRLPRQIVLIPLGTEGQRAADIAFEEPSGGGARRPVRASGVTAVTREETGPPEQPEAVDTSAAVVAEEPGPPDSAATPVEGPRRGPLRIGPAAGEGKLWIRPIPLPPRELAGRIVRSHAELVDSAVTAIVQVYIDSVLNAEPANAPLPRWVARVGDQQIGVDQQWIYLGPIKIPTALVAALLPLNLGSAAATDYERFRSLRQMREDVAIAARRSQTMEDFKRAIRELRAQREQEREFAKNQRTPPKPKTDTTAAKPVP